MFEHHRKTIENLKEHFEKDDDNLALIVIGSVARGDALEQSDVDFYLVVRDAAFAESSARDAMGIDASEYCVPPCPEAGGSTLTIAAMRNLCDHGNEIARWAFHQAKVIFSKDEEINRLVEQIPTYPETDRIKRMESFHSQILYHFSFFEFAFYSQTKYLIYETTTKMILSAGRLILADNRMLYPNRKRFFSELMNAPDKPAGICEAMLAFLDQPTIEAGQKMIDLIQSYKAYPLPPEGIKSRIAKESLLNLEEW
ncbi:MAG TPA: nucleotidyltransferase domain-containing protein [Anaerolineales bacterium]|nr:nucleotidyltransferase domain-containing protein [Anaerolineales bacterium]